MNASVPSLDPAYGQRGAPPVVIALIAAITASSLLVSLSDRSTQLWALWTFAVLPVRFDGAIEPGAGFRGLLEPLGPLFGHAFIHGGIMHLAMNMLFLLQAGVPVARRLGEGRRGWARFSALFAVSTLGGALAYLWLNPGSDVPAVGASGAVCGVFAAFFLGMAPNPRDALRLPGVRIGVLIFLGVNVGLAWLARGLGFPIAWEAHLGGFLVGLAAYPLLTPRLPGLITTR